MQAINVNIIMNAVNSAKYKLSQHRVMGEKSNLSIIEVARLMDTIRKGEGMNAASTERFSLN